MRYEKRRFFVSASKWKTLSVETRSLLNLYGRPKTLSDGFEFELSTVWLNPFCKLFKEIEEFFRSPVENQSRT